MYISKQFSEKNHILGNSITTLLLIINIVNCTEGEKQTPSHVCSLPVTKVEREYYRHLTPIQTILSLMSATLVIYNSHGLGQIKKQLPLKILVFILQNPRDRSAIQKCPHAHSIWNILSILKEKLEKRHVSLIKQWLESGCDFILKRHAQTWR